MALPETIRKAAKEKAYIRRYGFKLNLNTDADIIAHLSKQESMQGYVKRLIREDIARNQVDEQYAHHLHNAAESFYDARREIIL